MALLKATLDSEGLYRTLITPSINATLNFIHGEFREEFGDLSRVARVTMQILIPEPGALARKYVEQESVNLLPHIALTLCEHLAGMTGCSVAIHNGEGIVWPCKLPDKSEEYLEANSYECDKCYPGYGISTSLDVSKLPRLRDVTALISTPPPDEITHDNVVYKVGMTYDGMGENMDEYTALYPDAVAHPQHGTVFARLRGHRELHSDIVHYAPIVRTKYDTTDVLWAHKMRLLSKKNILANGESGAWQNVATFRRAREGLKLTIDDLREGGILGILLINAARKNDVEWTRELHTMGAEKGDLMTADGGNDGLNEALDGCAIKVLEEYKKWGLDASDLCTRAYMAAISRSANGAKLLRELRLSFSLKAEHLSEAFIFGIATKRNPLALCELFDGYGVSTSAINADKAYSVVIHRNQVDAVRVLLSRGILPTPAVLSASAPNIRGEVLTAIRESATIQAREVREMHQILARAIQRRA